VVNAHLVDDPTIWQPGFTTPRQQWSLLNRFRISLGHCGAYRKTWHLTDSDLCPCAETQMTSHIVESCPLTKLNSGLSQLHCADDAAMLGWPTMGLNRIRKKNISLFRHQTDCVLILQSPSCYATP